MKQLTTALTGTIILFTLLASPIKQGVQDRHSPNQQADNLKTTAQNPGAPSV